MKPGRLPTMRAGLALARDALQARSLAQFYDSLAARYDDLFGEVQRQHAIDMVGRIEDGAQSRFVRALDLGAGTGILTRELRRVAARVVALDLSGAMLRIARQNAAGSRDLDYVQGTFLAMPFADHSFDLVCGLAMMSHLPLSTHESWANGIARVMRRPGRIVIAFSPLPWRIFLGGRSMLRPSIGDRVLAATYNAFLAVLRLEERRTLDDPARVATMFERRGFRVTMSECGSLAVLDAAAG